MMRVLVFAVLLGVGFSAWSQKVGLVLSGGAAKGIAHLGVLKALEENNIPVDYIVGTSMGGIIGGCYAAGMTPEEIERLILSEDFLRWVNGLPERGYNYYYNKKAPNPDFVSVNLNLDSALSFQFASNIASDVSLNFALAEFMARASEASGQNFDSLFIPLRLLASDIFTQSQVVLARGSLADALRATQAVPFFYSPIRIDGKYLFDGGIYNNFPVDVAQREFQPEVIIGSNVSSKIFASYPYDQDEELISNSLLYMLLDNSDPQAVIRNGVYLQPNVTEFTAFDFSRARALIDSGYHHTCSQMEVIRKQVTRRTNAEELTLRRQQFHARKKPLIIDAITFTGFNPHQRKYIQRMFKYKPDVPAQFNVNQIKSGYFKLVSEPYFTSIYPSLLPNPGSDKFRLNLSQRPQKNFQVDIGGVLVSRNLSNIFMGLNYYHFNKALSHTSLTLQTGSFYKSVIGRVRLDFPFFGRFYLEPEAFFNEWDYVESTDLLQQVSPTVLRRFDRRVGLAVGWPLASRLKATVSVMGFNNDDRYSNQRKFVSGDTLDQLKVRGFKSSFALTTNDMDRKQYPSSGKALTLAIDYFDGKEIYEAGSTSETPSQSQYRQWFRLTVSAEQYFRTGWYRPGYLARAVFSNQPAFSNYTGTVVNAPAFYPMQDSPTLVNENFRAFNYLAVGLRNVFILKPNLLDFRLEGYAFRPIEEIKEGTNQEVVLTTNGSDLFFAATAGPVVHTPIGPISLSVNYYDDPNNTWGVLLHVGFLMFNKHTIDQ